MSLRPRFLVAVAATASLLAGLAVSAVLVPRTSTTVAAAPQKGGARVSIPSNRSRMDTFNISFSLTGDQRSQIKTILDNAYKDAAPLREGLTTAHAAIAAAIQGSKAQAEIDAAVKQYAEHAAAMASLEMEALADMMKVLTEEQRGNTAAISNAFFMLRGAFIEKKWDDLPSGRLY